jgi:hypothetical protein
MRIFFKEKWALVVARTNELKRITYSGLACMPHYSEVHATCDGRPIVLATWIDKEEGQVGVAVHAVSPSILGSDAIVHDGFFVRLDGVIQQMPIERQLRNV